MEIPSNGLLYVMLYLVLATIFTQFFKVATKTMQKKEKDNMLRKIIVAILIIISVILIKI